MDVDLRSSLFTLGKTSKLALPSSIAVLAAIRPLVLTIVFCGATELQAQSLRGTVADAMTGEPLIGATVKIAELDKAGTVTDADGKFRLDVSRGGQYTVETRYIGYEPSIQKEVQIVGVKEEVLDIELRENASELILAALQGRTAEVHLRRHGARPPAQREQARKESHQTIK